MKKSLRYLLNLLLIIPFVLNSCNKDSEDYVEIRTWIFSEVEYYYDGTLLDYRDSVIGIWPTNEEMDHYYLVSHGGFTFNEDGTGKAFGLGEFEQDEYGLTYTINDDSVSVSLTNNNDVPVTVKMKLEDNKMIARGLHSDIYGWSMNGDNPEKIRGADGNCNHTLETVQIYTRKK